MEAFVRAPRVLVSMLAALAVGCGGGTGGQADIGDAASGASDTGADAALDASADATNPGDAAPEGASAADASPADAAAEAGQDAGPAACVIDGTTYAGGAANPLDACEVCDPAKSSTGWSNAALGSACGAGQVCRSGGCIAGCVVGGSYYASGAGNPQNGCQTCDPSQSTSAWTNLADGTACGSGQVCASGTCASDCFIGGAVYPDGTLDPQNPCRKCDVAKSVTGWSSVSDGTACAGSQVCAAGVCGGCDIGGTSYATGAANPSNPCQTCDPTRSISSWSNAADGTGCDSNFNRICQAGSCVAGDACGGCLLTEVCCNNNQGGYDCFDACSAY